MKVFVHTILNLVVKISSKLHEENYFKIKKNWQKIWFYMKYKGTFTKLNDFYLYSSDMLYV